MKKLLLAALLSLLWAGAAEAAWHLYVVPKVAVQDGNEIDLRPKYLTGTFSCMDYGSMPVMICANDNDSTTDATLNMLPDVQRIPDNLDQNIGAVALSVVQNALENKNIPSQWVTSGITYRDLLRVVGGFFAFAQRYIAVTGSRALLIGGEVTLNTQLNQLSATVRQQLRDTATSLGLDISGLAGNTTLRAALKIIADQWGERAIILGGVTI